MRLRTYEFEDLGQMARLFYDTVHTVCSAHYDQAQLDAWATGTVDLTAWDRALASRCALVAEEDGAVVGFADLDGEYLDRLYVHKDFQGRGVATALADALEERARALGAVSLRTHASRTARPFFEKRGYRTLEEQEVHRGGVSIPNFIMEKTL